MMMTTNRIEWDARTNRTGTSLLGYLRSPWSFEETVARLITLSQQDPTKMTDRYKVSVEFVGTIAGVPFTLYDYKSDRQLHIGGVKSQYTSDDIRRLVINALREVEPTPYTAQEFYDGNTTHSWAAPVAGVREVQEIAAPTVATTKTLEFDAEELDSLLYCVRNRIEDSRQRVRRHRDLAAMGLGGSMSSAIYSEELERFEALEAKLMGGK